ncbi:MAG: hypothetical protein JXR70_01430 [Spirochaetales bacterium]|nr:hypothetical protein [Spirochaetales bacterium]
MATLKTKFPGFTLKNPVILGGACDLTAHFNTVKSLMKLARAAPYDEKLFEEEEHLQSLKHEAQLHKNINLNAEFQSMAPCVRHSGPKKHCSGSKYR